MSRPAERAVLAAMLLGPAETVPIAADELRAEMFTDARDGAVFEAICRLYRTGIAVDTVTVADALAGAGVRAIAQGACEAGEKLGDVVWEVLADLEADPGIGPVGLPTGFKPLNDLTGGMKPGELWIIGGRPGFAKTALLCHFARRLSIEGGRPVGFISAEMTTAALAKRLLAAESGLTPRQLRFDGKTAEQDRALAEAASRLKDAPLWVESSAGITISRIQARALRWATENHIEALFVDYLQLIRPDQRETIREREVAAVSNGLKEIAMRLEIPVIAAAQLNRAVEGRKSRRPTLSDLRESGAIEQDADLVAFLHRPDAKDGIKPEGPVEVIIAKQRNGPTGTVPLYFRGPLMRFEERTNNEKEESDEA